VFSRRFRDLFNVQAKRLRLSESLAETGVLYVYIYIYIYKILQHIYIERERDRGGERILFKNFLGKPK
jgi:hypothetical protein